MKHGMCLSLGRAELSYVLHIMGRRPPAGRMDRSAAAAEEEFPFLVSRRTDGRTESSLESPLPSFSQTARKKLMTPVPDRRPLGR